MYDGQPTRNLHLATVQLQNASSRDLANVRIDAAVDAGSSILRSSGQLRGSLQYFPFAPEYGGILDEAMKRQLTPAEIAFWSKQLPKHTDLDKPVLTLAHSLRDGGNLGAHFDLQRTPNQEVAELMVDLLDDLLEFLFILPGRIEELNSRIAAVDPESAG